MIALVLLVSACAIPAYAADTGPKPYVVLDFEGLEGQTYYATLLSDRDSTGPWYVGDHYYDYMGPESVWQAFSDYSDPDGYYFLNFFADCTESQEFRWTYYPPSEFKVLLYFPETGEFVSSFGSFERYSFHSYFNAKVTQDGVVLKKDYPMTWELVSLVCRCVGTIAVELLIGWLFLFRGKQLFRLICVTNVVTQVLLNLLLNYLNYRSGYFRFIFFYAVMELAVFLLEGFIYMLYLRKHPQERALHPWLYALTANLVSFAVGVGIAKFIPGIF